MLTLTYMVVALSIALQGLTQQLAQSQCTDGYAAADTAPPMRM
jgi:hypothetical protein